jgi:hypothetical protein
MIIIIINYFFLLNFQYASITSILHKLVIEINELRMNLAKALNLYKNAYKLHTI